MLIEAVIYGTEESPADVVLDDVQAGSLQPWMLTVDPDTGEVAVVLEDPVIFHPEDAGRPHRWVRVLTTGHDEDGHDILEAAATTRVDIIYGAEPEQLQPLLPEDLYSIDEDALARNGLCTERVDHSGDDAEADTDDEPEPVYCGRLSSPDSFYRLCTDHNQARRAESDDLVRQGYAPTYGVLAETV